MEDLGFPLPRTGTGRMMPHGGFTTMRQRSGWLWAPMALALGIGVIGAGGASACPGVGKGRVALFPRLASHDAAVSHDGLTSLDAKGENNSMVGLWSVTFTSGGAVWDMSFGTWHSDGTEFDNAMDSPLISAVCQGVWERVGPKTVKLHHVGWNYDPTGTILLGTFTINQTDTLSNDGNSYTGVFIFQAYDMNGNPSGQPTEGTISAVRIKPS